MPPSATPSPSSNVLAAVSNTPFVDNNGKLTLSGLNLLQQICNAVFGVSALTLQTTFAGLPASPTRGSTATITDSNTNAWGATIAGGGTHTVMAWFNETEWTVIGK